MPVRKLKDDDGNVYEVDVPDEREDSGGEGDDDDDDTVWLDEEDIEWLRRKRREEAEASRTSQKGSPTKTGSSGARVVKLRGKQSTSTTGSRSENQKTRKRVLRLA